MPDDQNSFDLQAEAGLLASLIMDGNQIPRVKGILMPHYFYDTRHYNIFKVIMKLSFHYKQIDLVLINDKLSKDAPERKDWYELLVGIMESYATPANAMHYARIVKECWVRRETAKKADELAALCKSGKPMGEIIKAQHAIPNAADIFRNPLSLSDLAEEGLAPIDTRLTGEYEMTTGLRILNNYTLGLQRKWLYVLAAETSHGKTAMAIQMVCRNLINGKKCRYYTYDTSAAEIFLRVACYLAGETNELIWKPYKLGLADLNAIRERVNNFKAVAREIAASLKDKLFIKEYTTINEIEADLADGADIVVIDYIQKAIFRQETSKYEAGNEQRIWEKYTTQLKELGNRYNCVMLVLSQYSRKADKTNKRDRRGLYDLKQSSSIEQGANCVILLEWLWRTDESKYTMSQYEFAVPKVSSGEPLGKYKPIFFDYKRQQFADLEVDI